jgi:RHS repeat-associated protein
MTNPIQGVIIAPVANNPYKYRYNGKELQDELGLNMYDMDMRQYDPAIARWVVMDPVIHHSVSPYSAFDNNPVFWADPSGAAPELGSVFEQSGMQVASFEVQGTGTSIAAGGAEGESSSEESDEAKDPGKPKTAIGRFFDKIGKGIKSIFGGGSKGTPKGTLTIRGEYSYVEPDWLNVNDTGIGLGLGVKNFKVGNAVDISLGVTGFSLTYDKNEGNLNLAVGEIDLGAYIAGVGAEGTISIFETNFGQSMKFGTGTVSGGFSGVTREAATGSIYSKESGWFSVSTLNSPSYPANRMIDLQGNGVKSPMLIFGGDIRAGIFRSNVEVNVDQIMSGLMGGSGLGSDWK